MRSWSRTEVEALRHQWLQAEPYPHVVIDDAVSPQLLHKLTAAVAAEPHWPLVDEITTAMASAPVPGHPDLAEFVAQLEGAAARSQLAEVCGVALGRLLLRSYVYLPGTSLLPHADYRDGLGRAVAVIIYLRAEPDTGGELLLYPPHTGDTEPAQQRVCIAARPGRMVLLHVGPNSVHEVAEVTAGARVSLAGWFYEPGIDPVGTAATPPPAPVHEVLTLDDRCAAAGHGLVAQAREFAVSASWRETDVPTEGRFSTAHFDADSGAIASLLKAIGEATGKTLQPISGALLQTASGGYVLSKGLALLRPPQTAATVVVDLNTETVPGGEWVWHGARGIVCVQPTEPGKTTAVVHGADLSAYVRALPARDPRVETRRLLIWCRR